MRFPSPLPPTVWVKHCIVMKYINFYHVRSGVLVYKLLGQVEGMAERLVL